MCGHEVNQMSKIEISVVIPAFNEQSAIANTLNDLKNVMNIVENSYEIIVVDDGSTDNTAEIAGNTDNIITVQHSHNKGYGASLKTGINHARGEYILIIDADGTYPVDSIPELLKYHNEYEMVVASRTGKKVKIPFYRKPGKFILSKLANYLIGMKIPDLNSGLRIFKKKKVRQFYHLLPPGFSFTSTITLTYLCENYPIKFVPINYEKRQGKSKIKPFRDGMNFILLILKTMTYFYPLKIYLPISFSLIIAGSFIGLYQIISLHDIAQLPIFLILTGLQIGLIGLIADLIVKRSHLQS